MVKFPGWESYQDWRGDEECVCGIVFEAGVVFFAPGLHVFGCSCGHCGFQFFMWYVELPKGGN